MSRALPNGPQSALYEALSEQKTLQAIAVHAHISAVKDRLDSIFRGTLGETAEQLRILVEQIERGDFDEPLTMQDTLPGEMDNDHSEELPIDGPENML